MLGSTMSGESPHPCARQGVGTREAPEPVRAVHERQLRTGSDQSSRPSRRGSSTVLRTLTAYPNDRQEDGATPSPSLGIQQQLGSRRTPFHHRVSADRGE